MEARKIAGHIHDAERRVAIALILTGAIIFGLVATGWLETYMVHLPRWIRVITIFLSVKLGGDLVTHLMARYSLFIYEDVVREFVYFIGLAILGYLAIVLAEYYIGGVVSPMLPAVGAYIFFIKLPKNA